jgi:hypothetical protein
MENGWYGRVWFSSNRDIFFWKYFKWDSRDFFFEINTFFFNKTKIINEEIIKMFVRISYIFSKIRRNILNYGIFEYMLARLMIFCYLSIFYLYFFEEIIIFNKYILYMLVLLEILFVIFCGYLFNKFFVYYEKIKDNFLVQQIIAFIGVSNIKIFIDPIKEGTERHIKFEVNNTIWNIILGSSVTLNILEKYIIWVNKNTKGYFYKEMNVRTKILYVRLLNRSLIPWNILPNTRFVLFNLKYIQYTTDEYYSFHQHEKLQVNYDENYSKTLNLLLERHPEWNMERIPDYKLIDLKNIHLAYFEKTYSPVSVLSIQYLLRINYHNFLVYRNLLFMDTSFRKKLRTIDVETVNIDFYYNEIYLTSTNLCLVWYMILIYLHTKNQKLFPIEYFLILFSQLRSFDIETLFMIYFIQEDVEESKLTAIPNKFVNLSEYKKNFEILNHFNWYEEESIVWNKDMEGCLSFLNKHMVDEETKLCYFEKDITSIVSKLFNKYGGGWKIDTTMKENIEECMQTFELKFNKDIFVYKDFDFVDLHFMDNIMLEDWNLRDWDKDLILEKELHMIVKVFEEMNFQKMFDDLNELKK